MLLNGACRSYFECMLWEKEQGILVRNQSVSLKWAKVGATPSFLG